MLHYMHVIGAFVAVIGAMKTSSKQWKHHGLHLK